MSGLGLTFLRRGNLAHPTAGLPYIRFADAEVERICIENFSKDGIGVTPEDVENLTDIGNIFSQNKRITSFNEFAYFKNVKTLNDNRFYACDKLKEINLDNIEITARTSGNGALSQCPSLTRLTLPNIITLAGWVFDKSTALQYVELGERCASIGWCTFRNCPIHTLIIHATTPPSMTDTTLASSANIYVPDNAVDAYKAASGWSGRAARIYPISSL